MNSRARVVCCVVSLGLIACFAPRGAAAEPRGARYTPGSPEAARAWQSELREQLFGLLKLGDLVGAADPIPVAAQVLEEEARDGYRLQTIELSSTAGRRIRAKLALPPEAGAVRRPAVVAIHGHGGTMMTPFDPEKDQYKEFGSALARRGYMVISTDVGQHEVYEPERTLMGERLWDLMRCVDYVTSRPDVDPGRIGCAGLSLGGEMAMWLGAMDPRMAATVSAGFLTMMDQMEENHCMCWKFEGLRALVDFPDIYAMIAPRALQCQNGREEPETQFNVVLAQEALVQLQPAYTDLGAGDRLELRIHDGGHEIDLEALLGFLGRHLGVE